MPSRSVPCANVRQAAHLSRQLRSRPPPPASYNEEVISAVLRPPQNFRDTSCTRTRRWDVHRHRPMGRARTVGQGVADAFNLLVCAGTPVAVAGGASALVALPAFLLSALRGSMDGWVQL